MTLPDMKRIRPLLWAAFLSLSVLAFIAIRGMEADNEHAEELAELVYINNH